MFVDYFYNGRGYGEVGEVLGGYHWDAGLLRPYIDSRGDRCVTVRTNRIGSDGKPERIKRRVADLINSGIYSNVYNATSLRKDEWIEMDRRVVKAARQRLKAWEDLAKASSYSGFDGMSKTILEHETMSDPGEAFQDMDALSSGRRDTPRFQREGVPLPITHSGFWFSSRQLAVSRRSGTPLNMTGAEACGRRVAELIEQILIGTATGLTYGTATNYSRNPTVYGYTNFPPRNTKTDLTTPTGSNPEAIMNDVLEMRDQLYADNFFGPFILYHSTAYDIYMDNDYFRTGGTASHQTLRERIKSIGAISDVRRLDYLNSGYVMLLVQMTSDVAEAITGMDLTTVQWESMGGMRLDFKVMCIMVPLLKADYDGRCGIVHATTS